LKIFIDRQITSCSIFFLPPSPFLQLGPFAPYSIFLMIAPLTAMDFCAPRALTQEGQPAALATTFDMFLPEVTPLFCPLYVINHKIGP
jgi:hypothetical protein